MSDNDLYNDEPDEDEFEQEGICDWCGLPLCDDLDYGVGRHAECEAAMWEAIESRDRAYARRLRKMKSPLLLSLLLALTTLLTNGIENTSPRWRQNDSNPAIRT